MYLSILNLPPALRMKGDNILLCGLWHGPTKPPMKKLLDPVLQALDQLSVSGIQMRTPDGECRVRAKVVMGLFDLPAKAAVLCMKQFNGVYGCNVCTHPGRQIRSRARVYPFSKTYTERTHESIWLAATDAQRTMHAVKGVKDLSPLAAYMDLVCCIPIDYMHAVLEGVVRMLTKSWFVSHHHREPQYIGRQLPAIDLQLVKQRPPLEFSRVPRSISKDLNYWKASELRYWVLYYALPLLLDHLPREFWHHFCVQCSFEIRVHY